MTLFEWECTTGAYVGQHDSGARWVPDSQTRMGDADRHLLWRLDDYLVRSVVGGSIWLLPRQPRRDDHLRALVNL